MMFTETTKSDRKSGGSREPALSEVERGPAVSAMSTLKPNLGPKQTFLPAKSYPTRYARSFQVTCWPAILRSRAYH